MLIVDLISEVFEITKADARRCMMQGGVMVNGTVVINQESTVDAGSIDTISRGHDVRKLEVKFIGKKIPKPKTIDDITPTISISGWIVKLQCDNCGEAQILFNWLEKKFAKNPDSCTEGPVLKGTMHFKDEQGTQYRWENNQWVK